MSDELVYRLPPPSPWDRTTLNPAVENAAREDAAARLDAAIARRQADAVAREAAQAQRERDEGAAALDTFYGRSSAAFIVNGGTADDFQRAWPELKRRYLIDRAEAGSPRERAIEQAMAELRSQDSDGF
jgi:hypothetical protein